MRVWDRQMSYRIVRNYFNSYRKREMARYLTLEEAQAWCSDPETSSSTATGVAARARTRKLGPWFDSYMET